MSSPAKQSLSFRARPQTIEHLRRRAQETGESQGELAGRLIDEGLRMEEHPRIYFREGARGRYPALRGTRLGVSEIVEIVRENGDSLDETAAYLELPVEDVLAVASYYGAYKDEVDEWALRAASHRKRTEELARRGRELFS